MGDSDDEYDRRRQRDKFRRERNDYDRGGGNRRDDWGGDNRESGGSSGGWTGSLNRDRMQNRNRDSYGRDSYTAGGGGIRRDRHGNIMERSGDMSPPNKRMRARDWDDRGYNDHGQIGQFGSYGQPGQGNQSDSSPTQPRMKSFKQFLSSLDDNIDDQESLKLYNEYKMDFKKEQIHNFFLAHKDEEWFRSRYHPEECGKRKEEQTAALKNRLDVFLYLLNNNWIDSVSIDVEKADKIIRLLDAAVIKLEGGSDFDLKALDETYDEEQKTKDVDLSLFDVDLENPKKAGDLKKDPGDSDGEIKEKDNEPEMKRKNEEVDEDNEEMEEEKEANVKEEETEVKEEEEEMEEGESKPETNGEISLQEKESEKDEPKPRPLHKTASIFLRNLAPSITKQEVEAMCKKYPGYLRVAIADPQSERRFYRRGWVTFERNVNIRDICWQLNSVRLKECELGAIVNRDLTRRIRSVNGITSQKDVLRTDIRNVAKIVLNLDKQKNLWVDENEKKKEKEKMKTEEKEKVENIEYKETSEEEKRDLEEKEGEGGEEERVKVEEIQEEKVEEKEPEKVSEPIVEPSTFQGFQSKNPLLKNITDYMIEEASAEEEELLGAEAGDLDDENGSIERDESLMKVLDKLLLYLRIVHSVDYYNGSDYPIEDEMPNRIAIMHARGAPPSSKVKSAEVNEYIKMFEAKIANYLKPSEIITTEDANKMGFKDEDNELEEFIKSNTQELAKDKWLCPLSGKKFKGPNFVRKHILNKHAERLEEVKKDVSYFNNYLMDPKRPQLPEHPANRPHGPGGARDHGMAQMHGLAPWPPHALYPGGMPMMPMGMPRPMGFGPMAGFGPGRNMPPMGPPMDYGRLRGSRYGRRDPRDLIGYGDLDDQVEMI